MGQKITTKIITRTKAARLIATNTRNVFNTQHSTKGLHNGALFFCDVFSGLLFQQGCASNGVIKILMGLAV